MDNSIFGVLKKEPDKLPPPVIPPDNGVSINKNPVSIGDNPENNGRSTQSRVKQSRVEQSKVEQSNQANAENDSKSIERFIQGFEKRFSASFSRDNVAALKNSILKHRGAIETDYLTIEIFLRTILQRMEDIQTKKPINNPIRFFFAGAFGAMYLWNLTPQEEESGSGYHKVMVNAAMSGKSPVAGLKTM